MDSKVYHGDCLEIMEDLPEKSFDAIITDPPFGTTQCKWDSPIDLELMWEHYKALIKDNGVILMFAQTPFDKVLGASNIEMLKYEWIWEKPRATGHFNAKKMPMKAHENILVFYKNLPKFFPQKTQGHKPANTFTKRKEVANKSEVYGSSKKDITGGGNTDRYPRDVIVFSSDTQKNKGTGLSHPTQKPLELMKYLLRSYSEEGDVILDTFAGSGTTGLACKEMDRKYVLIEKEKKYIDIINKRLQP